jgi:hypothetical protein
VVFTLAQAAAAGEHAAGRIVVIGVAIVIDSRLPVP